MYTYTYSGHSSCVPSHESVSVSASLAPRVGGWLAHNGFSVRASLPTESPLYSVLTQNSWIFLTGYHSPPHSEVIVGKRTRMVSKRRGKP